VSFQAKSTFVMTVILVVVYGAYFSVVGTWLSHSPVEQVRYQPLMVIAVVPLVILAALSHSVLAIVNRREAHSYDERDRLISLRGEEVGGYILAVGVFCAIVLAMAEFHAFYLAHTLMLAWVLAEVFAGVTRLVLYRRGA
jgi:hypothetical protein